MQSDHTYSKGLSEIFLTLQCKVDDAESSYQKSAASRRAFEKQAFGDSVFLSWGNLHAFTMQALLYLKEIIRTKAPLTKFCTEIE